MSELNVQYLQSLEDHINAVQTCEDLQKAVDTVMNALGDQLQALTDELEIVGAIQELLEIPNNLAKVITWIQKYIELVLSPMYQPYLKCAAQITQLIAKIQQLQATIIDKMNSITNCSVNIPAINLPEVSLPEVPTVP
jgi:hypothetical protein